MLAEVINAWKTLLMVLAHSDNPIIIIGKLLLAFLQK